MEAPERSLPEFDLPPVSEVAIGVEFLSLETWRIPHFGLYWNQIRAEYPKCEVHPPIPSQPESSGILQPVTFRLGDPNYLRCWYLDNTGGEIVQVQPDR